MKKPLLYALCLCGFISCTEQKLPIKPGSNNIEKISYLALGDSYTIGTAVKPSETWCYKVAQILNWEAPTVLAQAGYASNDLIRLIETAKPEKHKKVSLLIGVNNHYRRQDKEDFKADFRTLVLKAIELANNDKNGVFVVSIPDYGHIPAPNRDKKGIAEDIDMYNEIAKNICAAEQIRFVDITTLSRTVANDPSLAADEFHFSAKMYQLWAEKLAGLL